MPIFKLSTPKTMRLLSGHILPRNDSNFTCSHLDLKIFVPGEKPPDPCLQGQGREKEGWEGVKGFLLLEVDGGKTGEGREKGK